MKKLPSRVAHNRSQLDFFQYCHPPQNQPKSHILFHKNDSLRDFYTMTLTGLVKLLHCFVRFQIVVMLNPYGTPFHAVVVFGLISDFLIKYTLSTL